MLTKVRQKKKFSNESSLSHSMKPIEDRNISPVITRQNVKRNADRGTAQTSLIPRPSRISKLKNIKKTKNIIEKRPLHVRRYDQRGHFPRFDNNKNATRCKKENCKSRTHMYCVKCNVHLCIAKNKECFVDFHTLNIPEN